MGPFNQSRRRQLRQAWAWAWAWAVGAGLATRPVRAKDTPQPWPSGARYAVRGRLKGFGYKAQGQIDWTLNAGRYELRLRYQMPLVGQRTQVSQGQLTPSGLQPERYEALERRDGLWALPPNQGLQDKLSVLFQLAWLQHSGRVQAQAGEQVRLSVGKRADVWRFECLGPQTVQTELGPVAAVAWLRNAPSDDDTRVQVWYAPSQGHWPVRLQLQQGRSDEVDQTLQTWL